MTPSRGGPSAAVVIVGNEVLSGKVRDENGPFLLERLRGAGVEARRLLTVADEIDEIVWALRSLRGEVDWILTTGGVGPTHDDVTVAGAAAALGRRVVRPEALAERVRRHVGAEVSEGLGRSIPEAALRLADVPEGAELLFQEGIWLPLIVVERIALFPGVPALCRLQFEALAPRLRGSPFTLRSVYVSSSEPEIAAALDAVADSHPSVALGSYPRFDSEADHRVKLTLESRDGTAVDRALRELLDRLPRGSVIRQE